MKKRIWVLLVALLTLSILPAQAEDNQKYTIQQLQDKVQKMEILQQHKMPFPFVYSERLEMGSNQADINVFYTAQRKWKQNPRNFAAVFNYGLLIMSNDYGEGIALSDTQVDEAYRILEQAKKLRPTHKETYDLQVYLLDYKLFGPLGIGPGLSDEGMIRIFRSHSDVARKQLALLQTMFKNWGSQCSAWEYEQAALICRALQRLDDAKTYQAKADALYKQMEAQEAARKQAQAQTKKGLVSSIKRAFSSWRSK